VRVTSNYPERNAKRLYNDLSWIWPIIGTPEDYIEETETFIEAIKEHSRTEPRTLLNMGCGGGKSDWTFKKHFETYGMDLSEDMLKLARELNPEVDYRVGDMRTTRLGKEFDAVTILDAVNYLTTEEDLRSAFLTAYEHLKPGGVFLTLPEEYVGRFEQNRTRVIHGSRDDVEVVFVENQYDPDTKDTEYDCTFVYLIRKSGKLDIQTDHHVLGIFELDTWRRLLKDVGFEVNQLKFTYSELKEGDFYPMFVCVK
jgi:SAM-dependent methyltransferase